ncbi:NAD(P)-binding protein [Karstenula rhodostoma CBS 690.94]|uniref:NAD(P)-binding protein n=1 Tax=Karstenula rhodostoma CBS 690.94 TaxID=1392251 RepID=A0A9P4U8K7_9PLEO|nr:NAD(P)-binding protein [Karstenula rhodostoma CBS 690.94]
MKDADCATDNLTRLGDLTCIYAAIGCVLAHHLVSRGYRVGLCCRNVERGNNLASLLKLDGESVVFVKYDVSSESQAALFKTVWEIRGRIDVFIANARTVDGFSPYSLLQRTQPLGKLPPVPDLRCTETNYKGPIYGTVLATHFVRHNPTPGGKIIITSSTMAVQPCAAFPEYSATKATQVAWVRATAPVLFEKEHITINVVMPNAYDTGIVPGFADMFLPEHMVTKSCLLAAYDEFLNDEENQRTGRLVETTHDNLIYHERPSVLSEEMGERNCAVFEPLFKAIHGETSGIDGATKGLPNRETTLGVRQ